LIAAEPRPQAGGASTEEVSTIGLDLAKNVFQVHGVDDAGQVVVRRKLRRSDVEAFFRQLPPVTIGMEACGGGHSWARVLEGLGHCVQLSSVFGGPYSRGACRHGQPERRPCTTPLITRQSPTRGLPRVSEGNSGATRRICASLSQ
jgi:hypothetical protein